MLRLIVVTFTPGKQYKAEIIVLNHWRYPGKPRIRIIHEADWGGDTHGKRRYFKLTCPNV